MISNHLFQFLLNLAVIDFFIDVFIVAMFELTQS